MKVFFGRGGHRDDDWGGGEHKDRGMEFEPFSTYRHDTLEHMKSRLMISRRRSKVKTTFPISKNRAAFPARRRVQIIHRDRSPPKKKKVTIIRGISFFPALSRARISYHEMTSAAVVAANCGENSNDACLYILGFPRSCEASHTRVQFGETPRGPLAFQLGGPCIRCLYGSDEIVTQHVTLMGGHHFLAVCSRGMERYSVDDLASLILARFQCCLLSHPLVGHRECIRLLKWACPETTRKVSRNVVGWQHCLPPVSIRKSLLLNKVDSMF